MTNGRNDKYTANISKKGLFRQYHQSVGDKTVEKMYVGLRTKKNNSEFSFQAIPFVNSSNAWDIRFKFETALSGRQKARNRTMKTVNCYD